MDLESVREAISDLKTRLRTGKRVEEVLEGICQEYDINVAVLRHWFIKQEEKTVEEYDQIRIIDVSVDRAVAAAASRWMKDSFGPDLVGRRFCLELSRKDDRSRIEQRWFRYIGFTGYWVEAIDEESLKNVKFDGGREIWAEIRKKVLAAKPYENAAALRFWGSNRDLRERESFLSTMRLVLIGTRVEGDYSQRASEVDGRINRAASLTELYSTLSEQEREKFDYEVQNPSVQAIVTEDGTQRSILLEPQLKLLGKVRNGEYVPSPVPERISDFRSELQGTN